MNKKLSVIIPTLNEAKYIDRLVEFIQQNANQKIAEVIVVDANSSDNTAEKAGLSGAIVISVKEASRAYQMNEGAKRATGDILYFVHADAIPPESFIDDILNAVKSGYNLGCFRFRFKSKNPLLMVNSFFTRFKVLWCRGGDQTLFIDKATFDQNSGFNEKYVIMEDFELIQRLWNKYPFKIIPKSVSVSERKYKQNGYFKVNLANLKLYKLFKKGCEPEKLKEKYMALIEHS